MSECVVFNSPSQSRSLYSLDDDGAAPSQATLTFQVSSQKKEQKQHHETPYYLFVCLFLLIMKIALQFISVLTLAKAVVSTKVLTIANETAAVQGGASMYGAFGVFSINFFADGYPAGGVSVQAINPQGFEVKEGTNQVGMQRNIDRMGPLSENCDQPCRHLQVNMDDCSVQYVTVGQYCQSSANIPTWSPAIIPQVTDNGCVLMITAESAVDGNPDICGCGEMGSMPCQCGEDDRDYRLCMGVCSVGKCG